ncbi:MAG: flagellin [Planctomycetota bacterium]
MYIVNNTSAATVLMAYTSNTNSLGTAMERLSTGLKINHPVDDPEGLSLSENVRNYIAGLQQASTSEQSAMQYLNTLDGWYQQVNNTMDQMQSVAIRIDDPNLNTQDKYNLATEFNNLASEVNNIMTGAVYNNMSYFGVLSSTGGTVAGTGFQGPFTQTRIVALDGNGTTLCMNGKGVVGPGADFQTVGFGNIGVANATALNALAIAAAPGAGATIGLMVATLTPIVATSRAMIGAYEVQIQSAYNNNLNTVNNLTAVDTTIRSADIAAESQNMAKYQILTQSGQAMMAQANATMLNVLTLLR